MLAGRVGLAWRDDAFTRATALSTQPEETSSPVSMPINCAERSAGTFPQHDSSTAAAFRTGP